MFEGSGRWQDRANCLGADPELFFPDRGTTNAPAKLICNACEVRVECLQEAVDNREPGIYGGTTERERKFIRGLGVSAGEYLAGDFGYNNKRGRPCRSPKG